MQVDLINPIKTAMIVVDMQSDFVALGARLWKLQRPAESFQR